MSLDRSQLINTARSGLAGLGQGQLGVPLLLLVVLFGRKGLYGLLLTPLPRWRKAPAEARVVNAEISEVRP